jgi:hypothetical protein
MATALWNLCFDKETTILLLFLGNNMEWHFPRFLSCRTYGGRLENVCGFILMCILPQFLTLSCWVFPHTFCRHRTNGRRPKGPKAKYEKNDLRTNTSQQFNSAIQERHCNNSVAAIISLYSLAVFNLKLLSFILFQVVLSHTFHDWKSMQKVPAQVSSVEWSFACEYETSLGRFILFAIVLTYEQRNCERLATLKHVHNLNRCSF